MAFSKEVTLKGDQHTYGINPQIKRYSLKDVGFQTTKPGNFYYERSLDPTSPYSKGDLLKITISKDMTEFKMAVTTANGLQAINIFNNSKKEDSVTQYNFIMDNLVSREILARLDND